MAYLTRIFWFVSGSSLVLMMVQIACEVLLRFFFDLNVPGTVDVVAYYYMVAAIYLGIFVATAEKSHICTDVAVSRLPSGIRGVLDKFNHAACAVYFGLFTYALFIVAVESTQRWEVVDAIWYHLVVWPVRWIAALGIGLSTIAALILLVQQRVANADTGV